MANTVSYLSYANTFGDWVVTTNALVKENNDLAANNYVKPTGTLYLNSPTLGLQVANNAIISGQLQVQGIGSSAYIQNNLRVDTQVYFQNTVLGLSNSGELISNGKISAAASGLGLAVANNTTIGGTLAVGSNETIGGTLAVTGSTTLSNTLSVVGQTSISNTLLVSGDSSFSSNVTSNRNVTANRIIANNSTTTGFLTVTNSADISGQLSVGGNFVINGTTVYNTNTFTLNANSSVGLNSMIAVNRGTSGANASIRWTEANSQWELLNVNNSIYYRILTSENLSDSITQVGSINVATSGAVAALQGINNTQNTRIQSIETINTNQNTSISIIQGVDNTQNTRLGSIETINTDQNTAISIIQSVNNTQNTRLSSIETINNNQNTAIAIIQGVDLTQNAAIAVIQGVDVTQNTRIQSIETINNNQNTSITQVNQYAASAYGYANTLPTPSGTNATGTWNIGISGTAATATLATKASTVSQNGGNGAAMTFNWSGQSGQPTWLWGGNDGINHYVYNPSNFNVNFATTAGNITSFTVNQSVGTGNNVQFNSLGIGTGPTGTTGEIRATNNITAYFSDERLKKKLGNIENALEKVMSLNGFYHEANETAQALGYIPVREVGVSAQEVQKVLPEVVAPAPIDDKYLTVRYERMIPLLIEAIKELKAEIDSIKKS